MMPGWGLLLLLLLLSLLTVTYCLANIQRDGRPNIILILTDDQDVELGSMQAMNKTLGILGRGGTRFPNAFVTTPMCCPSRSSILTGKYAHNHHTHTNNENCSSPAWQAQQEPHTFAVHLSASGYRTAFFGKYLNEYNGSYVPPGWREWVALVKNSRFYNYTLCRNGVREKHGNNYATDYLTDIITNDSISYFRTSKKLYPEQPVLMVLSHVAPHGPEDSAPQYSASFINASQHITPSYNWAPNPDKHWILRYTRAMEPVHMEFTNMLQRRRLQTLLSVDDCVQQVYDMLVDTGQLGNTYLVYTADHGYHIGQFGLVKGKSMPYDFDIRVPFYVRGPGVKGGDINPLIVLNIDLAPTILDMGGVAIPPDMDGRSIMKLLKTHRQDNSIQVNMKEDAWRDSFLVERGKLLHKRDDGREEVTEDNFLPVSHRVEELCQQAEYWRPCQQEGEKWHCVTDSTGRPHLYRCDDLASASTSSLDSEGCRCDLSNPPASSSLEQASGEKLKASFHWSGSLGRWQPTAAAADMWDETENEKLAPFKVTYRCSILTNHSVRCDGGLYSSLQAWKEQNMLKSFKVQTVRRLIEVKRHKGTQWPGECSCKPSLYEDKHKMLVQYPAGIQPLRKLQVEDFKEWRLKDQKRKKKLRKLLKRLRNNDTCSMPGLTCFTHNNQHWQTAPFWTKGPFCACTSANNNSYWCLRAVNSTHNFLYCEFATGFLEYFDLNTDPYQLVNAVSSLDTRRLNQLHAQLRTLRGCRGQQECNLDTGTRAGDYRYGRQANFPIETG